MTLERYTRPEMKNIWSDETKYQTWLQVEIEASQAWANLGLIPTEDVVALRENASFTVERILEIEKETIDEYSCPAPVFSIVISYQYYWIDLN